MKKILISIPLIVFFTLVYFLYNNLGKDSEYLESALIGQPMPAFKTTELFNQQPVSSTQIKGPALINFWATWCSSCYVEHAMLLKLQSQGVAIYGVDYSDEREKAVSYLEQRGNPYALVVEDKKSDIGFDFGVSGTPETFFVDAQGKIRYRQVGVISEQNWQQNLKQIYESL